MHIQLFTAVFFDMHIYHAPAPGAMIYIYIYISVGFRGCHQAAKEQCSSYRTFYVMTVYFPSLIADCLILNSIQ